MYEWLHYFNAYGWFSLIIFLEYLFPNRRYELLNQGWLSDLFHTYEPMARAMLINACVVGINGLLPMHGPLKDLLLEAPAWQVFLMALFVSETSFYLSIVCFTGIRSYGSFTVCITARHVITL